MIRVITMIVLAVFSPMQLYAVDFGGFGTDTQVEYFVPRGTEAPPQKEWNDPRLTEKIAGESPKKVDTESSGTNWWLWGGLAVLTVGVIAAVAGGGGGGGGGGAAAVGGGATTTTVTGSW